MKKKLLALFMGSALVLGACGGGDTAEKPAEDSATTEQAAGGDAAGGGAAEELYAKSCASCHGQNLEGGVGPALDKEGTLKDAAGIEAVITNGQGAMPAGLLQGEEAKAVAEWLAAKK